MSLSGVTSPEPTHPRQHDSADLLLQVEDLHVRFQSGGHTVYAINGVSFSIAPGETLGIVGESGCGKSVTNLAIMGLLPADAAQITGGRIWFDGQDITHLSERGFRALRGPKMAMIFQDPMSGLNPVLTIGEQITEVYHTHQRMKKKKANQEAAELLNHVGIPDATAALKRYPHEFSGGMRQRVMIAMALALRPKLIIADEPTTALDPTVEAQILDLLRALIREIGSAMILISHDFEVVSDVVDRVAVMYAGRIIETGPVATVLNTPLHPYSSDLMACLPSHSSGEDLAPIEGAPPNMMSLPPGCLYADRCKRVSKLCWSSEPPLAPPNGNSSAGHFVACHHPLNVKEQNAPPPRLRDGSSHKAKTESSNV